MNNMTSGDTKRKAIFDKFSANLKFLQEEGIINIELQFNDTYICPICLEQFSAQSLNQSTENPLTLEDAPPKSLGGKANILTCKKCNNTCGHEIDNHLVERMKVLDNQEFRPNNEFSAKFEINGNSVNGLIKIDEEGTMQAYHIDKNNHPVKLQDYKKTVKPNTIINIHIDKKKVNPIYLQLALLKTGYLLVFEKYGYSLILDNTYDRIRHQLMNPYEIIYPLDFWRLAPLPNEVWGVPFITDEGLEAICPIFPLKTKSSERVFVTIIPISTKAIEDVISELKNRFKQQKRFPVRFDPMNGGVDYLTHLEAIKKMKKWINNLNNTKMENKFKQFINDNKGFAVFYLIWFFINLIFVSVGEGDNGFWPFSKESRYNDFLEDYGIIEFIFYLISPIIIWALWKLIVKDIKKAMEDKG